MEISAINNSGYQNYSKTDKKSAEKKSDDKKFSNVNEFTKYLRENYSSVKEGATSISSKYLRDCLKDDEKQQKLFENLKTADEIYKNAEKNQNVRVKIDSEGEVTVESSKTTVGFNEAKRARQLAAAKNLKDIQALMNLLQTDLSECEEGLKNNWCDEAEVKKVKKMIERAKQKMNELKKSDNEQENNFSTMDIII